MPIVRAESTGTLDRMEHIISGMKNPDKVGHLFGVIVRRVYDLVGKQRTLELLDVAKKSVEKYP